MKPRHAYGEMHGESGRREGESAAGDMLMGAIAGAVGVWAMDQVDWYFYDRVGPAARQRTQSVRPHGRDPAHNIVRVFAEALRLESPHQPHPAGVLVHYALGIGPGAAYGALRDRTPGLGAGRGLAYGLGLFALQDEIINAATGLSAHPRDYPWQAHARGLVAHLVLGVVTDTVFNLLKGSGRPLRYPRPVSRRHHAHSR